MASRVLFISGFVLTCIAALCTLIAFSTPHWIESFSNSDDRRFLKMGLWEACFDHWTYYRDYQGKIYDGCWWIFSFEYRPILEFLLPGWMISVQVMITITLLVHLVAPIIQLLQLIGCMPGTKAWGALLANSILMLTSGLFIGISVCIFGIMSDSDRQWLPRPDQNYLSFSFGLQVVSGFLCFFSSMCFFVECLRIRETDKRNRLSRMPGPGQPYGQGQGYPMGRPPY